ncbi:MAG TPA: hypothetical protein VNV65_10610 [Candidatus Solibacter sp.]|jgi:hypothetical protein|nr:hypothetical protein [Candidatus Solibacter sp.]
MAVSSVRGAAAAPSIGTVDEAHKVLTWNGASFSGLLNPPLPAPCAYNCDQRSFSINLPASAWAAPDSGVLVSIHYPSVSDSLALYVFDSAGNLAGSSFGIDTNGQAVFLAHPTGGDYQVVVTETYAQDPTVSYVGDIRYQATRMPPCAKAVCDLLPRLSPAPPANFHLSGIPPIPSTEAGTPIAYSGPGSCYLDELAAGANRCLRFTQDIRNVGIGPLELRFRLAGVDGASPSTAMTNCQMEQVVYRTDGSTWTRPAGPCVYHLQHQHFHYQNMALNTLHRVLPTGVTDPATVRTSQKLGFCLEDVDNFAYGSPDNMAPGYAIPNNIRCQPTGLPSATAPQDGIWETMGITKGWGDVYTWDLPSQFIEVTGVPDGVYEVVNEANPDHGILETTSGSQASATRICIQGSDVKELPIYAADCAGHAPVAASGGGATNIGGGVIGASTALPDTSGPGPDLALALWWLPAVGGVLAAGIRRKRF